MTQSTSEDAATVVVHFPGGKRVDATCTDFTICTDQPVESGGDGSAPSPFDLFLASLATCAGFYVLQFCRSRNLPTEGVRVEQRVERDPVSHVPTTVHQVIHVPNDFPERYRSAIARAAESCTVKKAVLSAPNFHLGVAVAADPDS